MIINWRHSLFLATALTISAANSFAGEALAAPTSWLATFSFGYGWEDAGETQTFFLAPNIEKTYFADSNSHRVANGEIFIAYQQALQTTLDAQLGLALALSHRAYLTGQIWDDAQIEFNNDTYHYKINHLHLALKGKVLANRNWFVTPWVSGSLGLAYNRSHAFDNSPLVDEVVNTPCFSDKTKRTFTYTLGAGVQKGLNQHWQMGIGYEFSDWGKSQLNRAPEQTLNGGLSLSHLYVHALLLNLTYLA